MAQKIVGLDIGSYSIKAVVLESTYRNWELIGYHESRIAKGYVQAERMVETFCEYEEDEAEASIKEISEIVDDESTGDSQPEENQIEEVEDTTEIFDPEKERKRIAIHEFLRKYGRNWDSVYTALASDTVSLKMISMPFAETKQIDGTINMTLEDMVPFHLDNKLVDYQLLKKEPGNNKILAGIIDKAQFRSYLQVFEQTDNEPKKVLLDSLALGNLALQFKENEELTGTYAIADFGHRNTSICIISEGQVAFVRTLDIGGQDFTQAIANSLDLSFENAEKKKHREAFLPSEDFTPRSTDNSAIANIIEEAFAPLIRQINLTFKSYTADSKMLVEKLFIVGGTSKLKNLEHYLSEKLEIPVEHFNYLKKEFNRLADSDEVQPNMANGLGIAFAGLSVSRKKALNFRKGDFAFKGDFEYWKGRIAHIALNATFIFMFFILSIWSQFHVLGAEETAMSDSIASSCKSILGRNVSDAKICISQMMEVIDKQGTGGSKLKPSFSLLTIYDDLISKTVTEELNVELEEIEITDKKIKIKGQSDTIPTVGQVVENLKTHRCFHSVKQGPTKSNVKGDRIQFSVSILVDCTKKKAKRAVTAEEPKEKEVTEKEAKKDTP